MADILLFTVADRRGGLVLSDVTQVLRAITITELPMAPRVVEGVVNLRGRIVPVIDLRSRLGLPSRAVEVSDRLVVASVGPNPVALRVDQAGDILAIDDADIQEAIQQAGDPPMVAGAAKLKDGALLIYDVDLFLSETEAEQLGAALAEGGY